MQFEPIYRRVFDNGLVLVSERVPGFDFIEINIGTKVGSAYELSEEEGTAHFLEHLMWKRKNRKESNERSFLLDKHGLIPDAETYYNVTNFLVNAPKDKLELAFSIAFDDLQNYKFDSKNFENERDVVLTEIKSDLEDNELFGYYRIKEKLFEGGLERGISGRYDKMSELTRDKVISFKQKWYVPNNMVISVVGNFEQKELEDVVEKTFGSLTYKRIPKISFELSSCKKKTYVFNRKGLELVHLNLGFQPVRTSFSNGEYLDLLSHILETGEFAILRQELREKDGLVYFVKNSLINPAENIFYHFFELQSEIHNASKAERKLKKVFDILKKGEFSLRRFENAKTLWKSILSKKLFGYLAKRSETLLNYELRGDRRDYRGILRRIDKMTYERTQNFSRDYFSKPHVMVKLVPE